MVLEQGCQPRLVEQLLPIEEKRVASYSPLNLGFVISKKIYHSGYASIFFDVESKNPKLKIVVKKKDYSLAIHRNKIKRWIREIFRKNLLGGGYVVVVRGGFLEVGFKNISFDFGLALDNFVNSSQDD
tara:strand:+ start:188 stop:571 length:384 start_codon:yes stop_codon:yes gene_type:complete